MSASTVIGEIIHTRGDVTIKWEIGDFLSLSHNVDDCYHSPAFSFSNSFWSLMMFPNGQTDQNSSKWVGLYLVKSDSRSSRTVSFAFGVKASNGVIKSEEFEYDFPAGNRRRGSPLFCSRSELKSILQPNDVLTIFCALRNNVLVSVNKGEKKLQESLITMLRSREDSDVVLKVRGKKFFAHKVILRARSPVFRSMFTHEMVEKQSSEVIIEDLDPEAFSDFLIYIYSGCCVQISGNNVISLFTAADKYGISELKELCTKFMKRNLTVSCFCDVITLAVLHEDKALIEDATRFFCEKSSDIVKESEWQTFIEENPRMANELMKALSKNQSRVQSEEVTVKKRGRFIF